MYGVPACTVYHKHLTLVSNSMLAQLGSTCMEYTCDCMYSVLQQNSTQH